MALEEIATANTDATVAHVKLASAQAELDYLEMQR